MGVITVIAITKIIFVMATITTLMATLVTLVLASFSFAMEFSDYQQTGQRISPTDFLS